MKLGIVRDLLGDFSGSIQLITRASFGDFYAGVSDIEGLRFLIEKGAQIKVLRGLHSKLYLFDDARAIVTSANLTESGLKFNHELSISTDEQDLCEEASTYFNNLWTRLKLQLDNHLLDAWQVELDALIVNTPVQRPIFRDAGEAITTNTTQTIQVETPRYHLKLWGKGDDRESYATNVKDVVRWSNGHVTLGFPSKKKPRRFKTGDIAFHGVMVEDPNDIIIYGRSLCHKFVELRDMSTQQDIQAFSWKNRWGANIRVYDSLFMNSILENGISVADIIQRFGINTFVDQYGNYEDQGPSLALRQKASKFLSPMVAEWLETQFADKVHQYGSFAVP